jgi:hypothetical protein
MKFCNYGAVVSAIIFLNLLLIDFLTTAGFGSQFWRTLPDTEVCMNPPGQRAAMIVAGFIRAAT